MALANSFAGVIFDYGGVLVEHQSEDDQLEMAKAADVRAELLTELYWSDRLDYDKGLVTGEEYWQAIGQKASKMFSPQTIARLIEIDTVSWMHYDAVMWEWVAELRGSGVKVAMLSNMPRDLGEVLKAQRERLDVFDVVTLSYEVRSSKPEPAIYELCLEGLGLEAPQTLFLDDRIANVQGAELLGINAVQFTNRDEVLKRLRA